MPENQHGGPVIAVGTVTEAEVSRYGIIANAPIDGRLHRVKALAEKPALAAATSRLAVFGRYVLTPRIFEILADTPPGAGGEIKLTDALNAMARQQPMFACEYSGTLYDCGTIERWLETNIRLGVPRQEMLDYFRNITGASYSTG
jgi:UTP--glucose-1-phosphate uridylyltransferase